MQTNRLKEPPSPGVMIHASVNWSLIDQSTCWNRYSFFYFPFPQQFSLNVHQKWRQCDLHDFLCRACLCCVLFLISFILNIHHFLWFRYYHSNCMLANTKRDLKIWIVFFCIGLHYFVAFFEFSFSLDKEKCDIFNLSQMHLNNYVSRLDLMCQQCKCKYITSRRWSYISECWKRFIRIIFMFNSLSAIHHLLIHFVFFVIDLLFAVIVLLFYIYSNANTNVSRYWNTRSIILSVCVRIHWCHCTWPVARMDRYKCGSGVISRWCAHHVHPVPLRRWHAVDSRSTATNLA